MTEIRRWLDAPEINVAIFTFLLNFVWEFAQAPLFEGMARSPHWTAILVCARATAGDVVIALGAFWAVSTSCRSRRWVLDPTRAQLAGFIAVGVVVTTVMEWLATHAWDRWTYGSSMLVVPGIEIGVAPLLQWIVVPPIVIWFVRRQLT